MTRPEPPIAALATSEGPAGLALLRVSGVGCRAVVSGLLASPLSASPRHMEPMALSWDATGPRVPGYIIAFDARASYTGEEAVEIYLPGSPPLVRRCLEALRRGVQVDIGIRKRVHHRDAYAVRCERAAVTLE